MSDPLDLRRGMSSHARLLLCTLTLGLITPSLGWAADGSSAGNATTGTASGSAASGKATARALALEAQQAFDAGDFKRAAELLARADQHYHAPPHLVLEARARIELGQLVEARELLLTVINEPETTNQAFKSAREEALDLVAVVDKRVAHLSVQVMPEVPAGLELTVDGAPWAADLLEVATPVNPGEHVVVARAPGFQEASGRMTLGEGQNDQLVLELVAVAAGDEPASAEEEPAQEAKGRAPGAASYVLWGTGLVGVGVGVTLLLTGADKSSQAGTLLEDDCTALDGGGYGCSQETSDTITALDRDAATHQTIGVIALSVGAAALVGGTVLALVGRSSQETVARDTKVRVVATPLLGGGYFGLKGAF